MPTGPGSHIRKPKPSRRRAAAAERLWGGRLVACGAATIVLATLLCYIPAMRGGFIWDDDSYLYENDLISSPDGSVVFRG